MSVPYIEKLMDASRVCLENAARQLSPFAIATICFYMLSPNSGTNATQIDLNAMGERWVPTSTDLDAFVACIRSKLSTADSLDTIINKLSSAVPTIDQHMGYFRSEDEIEQGIAIVIALKLLSALMLHSKLAAIGPSIVFQPSTHNCATASSLTKIQELSVFSVISPPRPLFTWAVKFLNSIIITVVDKCRKEPSSAIAPIPPVNVLAPHHSKGDNFLSSLQLMQYATHPISFSRESSQGDKLLSHEDAEALSRITDSTSPKTVPPIAEGTYYQTFCGITPDFVSMAHPGAQRATKTLYRQVPPSAGANLILPLDGKSEIVALSQGQDIDVFMHEGKTLDATTFVEAATYTAMAMGHHFFHHRHSNPSHRSFYTRPLVGFSTISAGMMGVTLSIEMIGVVFYSFLTDSFLAGTSGHTLAMRNVSDTARRIRANREGPIIIDTDTNFCAKLSDAAVLFTTSLYDGFFYKLISADSREPGAITARYAGVALPPSPSTSSTAMQSPSVDAYSASLELSQQMTLLEINPSSPSPLPSPSQSPRTYVAMRNRRAAFLGETDLISKEGYGLNAMIFQHRYRVYTALEALWSSIDAESSSLSSSAPSSQALSPSARLSQPIHSFPLLSPSAAALHSLAGELAYFICPCCPISPPTSATQSPPPPQIVKARLLFGYMQVAVQMPWIEGRESTEGDLVDRIEEIASIVTWLACHGFLYIDIRPPNFLITADSKLRLVDYDDCVLLKTRPPRCAGEVANTLIDNPYVHDRLAMGEAIMTSLVECLQRRGNLCTGCCAFVHDR